MAVAVAVAVPETSALSGLHAQPHLTPIPPQDTRSLGGYSQSFLSALGMNIPV